MDVFEAVRTVLAVRKYQDKPVSPDIVRRIVEAGRLTASSMNGQPWHFIVVENRETLRRLGALARSGPYIAQAPLAVVVAIEQTRFAVSDASRAIQSMILTAWSDGVGSNWVGFLGLTKSRRSWAFRMPWMCWRLFPLAIRRRPSAGAARTASPSPRWPTARSSGSLSRKAH